MGSFPILQLQGKNSHSSVDLLNFIWHMPDDATKGVVELNFPGCNRLSTCMSQLQPSCPAALVLNVLPRSDEGSDKPYAAMIE